MNIRLSIIVPFYNVEKYIEQCVRSLYDQDIPQDEYEVICVDDCSPDGSRVIVERLQKEYPNLQLLIHERNKKLGGARNTGLKAAKGEYIWFVDSDDYIHPNVFCYMLEKVESNRLDFLHFDYVTYNGKMEHVETNFIRDETNVMSGIELFFYDNLDWAKNHVTAWRKIYKREWLCSNNISFVEDIMYEDNDYMFRTYKAAHRVMHINLCPYVYRFNADSITRTRISLLHVSYQAKVVSIMLKLEKQFVEEGVDKRMLDEMCKFIRWITEKIQANTRVLNSQEQKQLKETMKTSGVFNFVSVCTPSAMIRLLKFLYFE